MKRAKITGPFGYIIKPFEDRELHSAIEVALYKHEMESKLTASENGFLPPFQVIGEAVITTDEKGQITFMNPMAQRMTGWEIEDAMGSPLENVFKVENEEVKNLLIYLLKIFLINQI